MSYTDSSVATYFNALDLSSGIGPASTSIHKDLAANILDHRFQFGLKSGTSNTFELKISGTTVNVDLTRTF